MERGKKKEHDQVFYQRRVKTLGGYNKDGLVFGIVKPMTEFYPTKLQAMYDIWIKPLPDKKLLEQFVAEFTFFQYKYNHSLWYSTLL